MTSTSTWWPVFLCKALVGRWVFGLAVEMRMSHIRMPMLGTQLHSWFKIPANTDPGRQSWWLHHLGSCHLWGTCGLSLQLQPRHSHPQPVGSIWRVSQQCNFSFKTFLVNQIYETVILNVFCLWFKSLVQFAELFLMWTASSEPAFYVTQQRFLFAPPWPIGKLPHLRPHRPILDLFSFKLLWQPSCDSLHRGLLRPRKRSYLFFPSLAAEASLGERQSCSCSCKQEQRPGYSETSGNVWVRHYTDHFTHFTSYSSLLIKS